MALKQSLSGSFCRLLRCAYNDALRAGLNIIKCLVTEPAQMFHRGHVLSDASAENASSSLYFPDTLIVTSNYGFCGTHITFM